MTGAHVHIPVWTEYLENEIPFYNSVVNQKLDIQIV